MAPSLFDDRDDDDKDEENWHTNENFAENYNSRKNVEALQRAKERGIDLDEDDEESSDDDSDGEHLTQNVEIDILKTIQAIREKDPKIYDPQHNFFNSDGAWRPCIIPALPCVQQAPVSV